MTLRELYQKIGGDYDQAIRVLRVEKLINKHICKFANNSVVQLMLDAGQTLEPTRMFEAAHAVKGVCGNLGLTELYAIASELSEEFRPGNARQLSDAAVAEKLAKAGELYQIATENIHAYEAGL